MGDKLPETATICAAIKGEKWAIDKIIEHYADFLDKMATIKKRQPDGSYKKVIDEDMRQSLALKLIEEIPKFPMDDPE